MRVPNFKNIVQSLLQVFSQVDFPNEVISDQGTPFVSLILKELCKLCKINKIVTSVYHPQTDGLVERFNKILKQMLKKVMQADGKDWDKFLPYLLFAFREMPQSSTGFSPFELLYGRHPRGISDIVKEREEKPSSGENVIEYMSCTQVLSQMARPLPSNRKRL